MYLQMERKSPKIPLNHKKDIQTSQSSQKKTIFNKCGNACIQRAAGDLQCDAKVWYVDKKGKNCETSFRTGVNNGAQGSVSAVLDTCDRYYLGNMRNMKGQNPPGQCAEPHAVSNCLQEIDINNFSRITHISVSDATFTQQCGTNVSKALKKEKDQEQARRPAGSVMPQGCIPLTTASEYQTFVEHVLSKKALRELQPDEAGARIVSKKFPRCTTCQQWINEENRVILSQISSRRA